MLKLQVIGQSRMVKTINKIQSIQTHTLSIQISLNGLSFCIKNDDNQILALENESFEPNLTPNQILDNVMYTFDYHSELQQRFKNIEVIHQNDHYTFVPKKFFDPKFCNIYLNYNTKVYNNDYIAYDETDLEDMVTVYIPYVNINNFFFETFGSFTYKHSSTILLKNLIEKEHNLKNTIIYIHLNSNAFDLVVFRGGKFILGNTYPHETKEDFLFYLMFVVEQLEMNPQNISLKFLGEKEIIDSYIEAAYKYVNQIDFGVRSFVSFAEGIEKTDPYEHFILLSKF